MPAPIVLIFHASGGPPADHCFSNPVSPDFPSRPTPPNCGQSVVTADCAVGDLAGTSVVAAPHGANERARVNAAPSVRVQARLMLGDMTAPFLEVAEVVFDIGEYRADVHMPRIVAPLLRLGQSWEKKK